MFVYCFVQRSYRLYEKLQNNRCSVSKKWHVECKQLSLLYLSTSVTVLAYLFIAYNNTLRSNFKWGKLLCSKFKYWIPHKRTRGPWARRSAWPPPSRTDIPLCKTPCEAPLGNWNEELRSMPKRTLNKIEY